jgi:hypothetical protein
MYRYSQQVRLSGSNSKLRGWLVACLVAVLLIVAVVMSMISISAVSFRRNTQRQFAQRMINCASDAIDQVIRLSSSVQSNTTAKLSLIRQYIYAMDQMNEMSIALSGEKGRLAPDEAFTALFSDLASYELQVQTATSSTLENRTQLLDHLSALKALLKEP